LPTSESPPPSGGDTPSRPAPRLDPRLDPDRDPLGVWADVIAAITTVEGAGFTPDVKAAWQKTQQRFMNAAGVTCRGHSIWHPPDATRCCHPICPSCWVDREIAIRTAIEASSGPWLISTLDDILPTEAAEIPGRVWRRFIGHGDSDRRLIAWALAIIRDPTFDILCTGGRGMMTSPYTGLAPSGYRCQYTAVLTAPGLPKCRWPMESVRSEWALESIRGWGYVGHQWVPDRDVVLDIWRERHPFTAGEFVPRPGAITNYEGTQALLDYLRIDPLGQKLRRSRNYQTRKSSR
jgi:hypothetical protein